MTEMIERVAKAIRERAFQNMGGPFATHPEHDEALARAAIEAMREPTPKMVVEVAKRGVDGPSTADLLIATRARALLPPDPVNPVREILADMVRDHRFMIGEALK